MNRLVLIDGNAILHRAYHALPPLTAPDGSLVNAVYGFCSMLFKIVHDLKPTHIAVAFDRPAPTFRKKMYKEYQATRPKMDEELVGQIEKVHDATYAFGIPVFEMDGFEADDVIGTLARRAFVIPGLTRDPSSSSKTGFRLGGRNDNENKIDQVIIVTGDKDILQLVDDKTYVYMPTKGLSEAKLYMEKDVVDRLGVKPKSIIDLKALMGDSSDNYPGVEGIGPKTAVVLLKRFGNIEKLYEWIRAQSQNKELRIKNHGKKQEEVSESIIQKLITGRESAKMSKDLATIRIDVPIKGELRAVETIDTPQAREMLLALHFHSLLKRLTGEDNKNKELSPPAGEAGIKNKGKEEKEKPAGEQQQLF